MFVRKKRAVRGNDFYQLVENYRENGKHRQRMLVHLGEYSSVGEALKQGPKDLQSLRRRATRAREDYEIAQIRYESRLDCYGQDAMPDQGREERRLNEYRRRAEVSQREADTLAKRLEALQQITKST